MPGKVETPRAADRRGPDRRARQQPIDFAERRASERRSGTDRRDRTN